MDTDNNTKTLWELVFWGELFVAPFKIKVSTDMNALREYHKSMQRDHLGYSYPLVEDIGLSNDMICKDICHWTIYESDMWIAPLSDK
jgi:hypothetical protein